MQPPQQYKARLEELTFFNERYAQYEFELIAPNQLVFDPGQYVSVKVSPIGERRSYSIINTPDVSHGFHLLLDLKPMGVGTQYMKSLQFGSEIELLAPMGRFVIPENNTQEHLVFIATGSGISPFRSMIEDQLRNKQSQKKMTLFWGMRYANELFWLDELQDLVDSFPNFNFHPVISQAPEEWTLCRGRVTDCLNVHALPDNALYFLCGNQQMITDVTALLTTQKGVDPSLVLTEKFF
jgi:NAD(P)H-flavin reductase